MTAITKKWFASGEPWVWLNAAAVSACIIMVLGLLILIAWNGMGHFWPAALMEAQLKENDHTAAIVAEIRAVETAPVELSNQEPLSRVRHLLLKVGNRDLNQQDFRWVAESDLSQVRYPQELLTVERREWGNLYGRLQALDSHEMGLISGALAYTELQLRLTQSNELHEQITRIKVNEIGAIHYQLENLRLQEKKLLLNGELSNKKKALLSRQHHDLERQYALWQEKLQGLHEQFQQDVAIFKVSNGETVSLNLSKIVQVYQPNAMNLMTKLKHYFRQIGRFVSDDPREANTEGGVFPAIFGTILMVIIMSILVAPMGIIAGIYLHEYATQGLLTRLVRIAVNNLAGVPSIVYGIFGLGFFVYFLGGSLDALFYPEASPAPVFGSPGLLWASMTLALLTLPVVIVSTEEGLARIPNSIREGSLALGATKAETLWRTILPMASPAMMTGLILAVARAAGEVAPLMLVGVVKLAPSLAIDGNAPFLHLERQFMHLGFHIYDVGLQSPNIEAARPLVFATALLLVLVIVLLNISAIILRNNLRDKYKGLEE